MKTEETGRATAIDAPGRRPRDGVAADWLKVAAFAVPIALGIFSIVLGQDFNWDLQNYHLYNPYAYLTGRLSTDLAPAGFQSYFNPVIDLPYFWMITHWPARAVGFAIGLFHGSAFFILLCIVGLVAPRASRPVRFFLALSGCLGAVFISELGGTMGDNTTAVFVLGGLAVCLSALGSPVDRVLRSLAIGGLLVGLGVGLKLTNGPFLVGMMAAVVSSPAATTRRRFTTTLFFTAGAVAGIAIVSGHWLFTMWETFGNPLFPQFNKLFHADLASRVSIVETRFRPTSFLEAALLPYAALAQPTLISEKPLIQLLWPVAYSLGAVFFAAFLYSGLMRRRRGAPLAPKVDAPPRTRFLFVFLAVGYLVWVPLFSITRYTVPLELLLPLTVWLLLAGRPWPRAQMLALAAIAVSDASTLLRPVGWGHAAYARENFHVAPLPIGDLGTATVLVMEAPVAWVIPFLPPTVAFIGLDVSFPESAGYRARARRIIEQRGGPVYVLLAIDPVSVTRRLSDPGFIKALAAQKLQVSPASCEVRSASIGNVDRGYRICATAPL